MKICLVADRTDHPVLGAMLAQLEARHRTRLLVSASLDDVVAAEVAEPADVYLLKARSPIALELAQRLERDGVVIVNTAASTARCRDRVAMARALDAAGIPAPRTLAAGTLVDVAGAVDVPAMVKSRLSRRGDLVRSVATQAELESLAAGWAQEPVIVQELCADDGWDYKAWVIGDDVHTGRRLSPLQTGAIGDEKRNHPISDRAVERLLTDLARAAGTAFGLELFGIDVLMNAGRAHVIDVNAFPGFRGVPDAAAKLAAYAEGVAGRTGAAA